MPVFASLKKEMGGTRVYVGGLGHRVTERDLEKFFRDYGRLRDIIIKNGFGFVVRLILRINVEQYYFFIAY